MQASVSRTTIIILLLIVLMQASFLSWHMRIEDSKKTQMSESTLAKTEIKMNVSAIETLLNEKVNEMKMIKAEMKVDTSAIEKLLDKKLDEMKKEDEKLRHQLKIFMAKKAASKEVIAADNGRNGFRAANTVGAKVSNPTEYICPFHPPGKGEDHGIADWGGWEYDLASIRTHHIVESAHHGVYEFLGPGKSLVDIGAGVGQMKVALENIGADINYVGFDGGSNIMDLEGRKTPVLGDENHVVPHLCWVDASKPFELNRTFDAVLSKEVGEHIPPEGEAAFMDNLARLARPHGGLIILTWAHPGQGGFHHVNCKEKSYVIAKMEERGVKFEPTMTESLGKTIASSYAENLMVFSKP